MGWVVLPPFQIYQCSSLLIIFSPAALQARRARLLRALNSSLPAGPGLAGRALCRSTCSTSQNPGALGEGTSPGARRGGRSPGVAELGHQGPAAPSGSATSTVLGQPPEPGAAAALPATARLQRQGGCLWDGLLVSFVLRSVAFLFSVVSDEVCRTPVHLLLFLSKQPHSPCQGRDGLARR